MNGYIFTKILPQLMNIPLVGQTFLQVPRTPIYPVLAHLTPIIV